jgi:hypothetical protein
MISSWLLASLTMCSKICDMGQCLLEDIVKDRQDLCRPLGPQLIKTSLNRHVSRDDDHLIAHIFKSLWRITRLHINQCKQGLVQPFWGMASPWKLVEDARIDLGLVISVARWATSRVIVHAARVVVEANWARIDHLEFLKDEVIF